MDSDFFHVSISIIRNMNPDILNIKFFIFFFQLNNNDAAIKDCTSAIDLDESYLKAYHRRAKCYMDSNFFQISDKKHKCWYLNTNI